MAKNEKGLVSRKSSKSSGASRKCTTNKKTGKTTCTRANTNNRYGKKVKGIKASSSKGGGSSTRTESNNYSSSTNRNNVISVGGKPQVSKGKPRFTLD